ncbi:MAG: hypothetical protein AAB486_00625 [Patescibacteria group bacterium]
MKKIPATSLLFLALILATPLLSFAIETDAVTETAEETSVKPACRELWYRDNNTPECQKKKFCGAFMYQGLMTFPDLEACRALSSTRQTAKDNPVAVLRLRQASAEAKIKENISQFKEKVEANKNEAVGKFKLKRDDFKAKVEKIKDEKKKSLAEKVDAKITEINTKRTKEMSSYIERMKTLLGKIQVKADEIKSSGKDTTTVDTAIKTAQTAIDKAAAAVTSQAGKQYVATIGNETTLKANFGQVAKQLEMDLKAVRQLLIEAKKAVADSAKALGQVRGGQDGTPSASPKE